MTVHSLTFITGWFKWMCIMWGRRTGGIEFRKKKIICWKWKLVTSVIWIKFCRLFPSHPQCVSTQFTLQYLSNSVWWNSPYGFNRKENFSSTDISFISAGFQGHNEDHVVKPPSWSCELLCVSPGLPSLLHIPKFIITNFWKIAFASFS